VFSAAVDLVQPSKSLLVCMRARVSVCLSVYMGSISMLSQNKDCQMQHDFRVCEHSSAKFLSKVCKDDTAAALKQQAQFKTKFKTILQHKS